MAFLFPSMLAGLLGLGVPVALHLIARHKFPVKDFPTLRLLVRDERTNTFAARLVDPVQLLLRLLVLALLVLAMARLSVPASSFFRSPQNLVVVVDGSASMGLTAKDPAGESTSTLFELARRKAVALLGEITAPSQCALVLAGDRTRVLSSMHPGAQEALDFLNSKDPRSQFALTDGSGEGLLNAIATAAELVRDRREPRSRIVVLSDLRSSAFNARNQKDLERLAEVRRRSNDRLEIEFIDLASGSSENLAILEARVRGSRVKVGDDAHLLSRIHNYGSKDKTAKLQISVGNQPDPGIKEVLLAAGEEAFVDLTTPVNRSVRTTAQVRFKEGDAMAADDAFSVPLNVAETRRVLIVNGNGQGPVVESKLAGLGQGTQAPKGNEAEERVDGATILRFVLNPGRELGRANGTGIDSTLITTEALVGQTLSKYELIVFYDVTSLPAQALEDVNTFVRQGRSLLFVNSGGVNAPQFNRLFFSADPLKPGLSPAQLGNDKEFAPALALAESAAPHVWLAPYRDKLQGDISSVRLTVARELTSLAESATPMLTAADGRALAVEMPLEKGRVALLAFGLELDRSNLARTRVFPPLMWRLVDYLTGQLRVRPPDVLVAQQSAVLDVSEPAFAFTPELELTSTGEDAASAPIRLTVNADNTVLLPPLPAGLFQLHKPRTPGTVGGHTRNITVHPDSLESDMSKIDQAQLAAWIGPVLLSEASAPGRADTTSSEIWSLLVWLLVFAYIAEAITGFFLNARREKQRAAESNA